MFPGHWSGTLEERDRAEAPLLRIDPALRKFSSRYGLEWKLNSSGWPDRSIRWTNRVTNLMQIYLVDKTDLTFSCWICSWQDRDMKRYSRKQFMFERERIERISVRLEEYLNVGYNLLLDWDKNPEYLELVGKLGNSNAPMKRELYWKEVLNSFEPVGKSSNELLHFLNSDQRISLDSFYREPDVKSLILERVAGEGLVCKDWLIMLFLDYDQAGRICLWGITSAEAV